LGRCHEHVFGFDVAMEKAVAVQVLQSRQQVKRQGGNLLRSERGSMIAACRRELVQVARTVLHDKVQVELRLGMD
jgi:hypothetical protein